MPELEPCPFCGSEAMTSWNNKFGWQAFCGNDSCFMSQIIATTFETEEQAIQSWNTRHPDCEHAEHDGIGCLGYCGCGQDDEPIEYCKLCEKYTSNITGEW